MKKIVLLFVLGVIFTTTTKAQIVKQKLYDEQVNPIEQIEKALEEAKKTNRYVICQMGGNWCRWCLMFADFIKKDSTINSIINDNFVYIHVNYTRKNANEQLDKRLAGASRFGFPSLVVLNENGDVLHIQDSSFLEEGEGYNQKKVMRFLTNWTPKAVKSFK